MTVNELFLACKSMVSSGRGACPVVVQTKARSIPTEALDYQIGHIEFENSAGTHPEAECLTIEV